MAKDLRTKVIGVPLTKGKSKKQEDGSLIVSGYFTSDNRDEIGDTITRGATERAIPTYRQWGNIRYMHQPRPVARVVRIGEPDGLEWNEVEIKVIDPQAVFEVENGLLSALSVGILVDFNDIDIDDDGGWIINDYQLAEISLVDHPANYDARLKEIPIDQGLRVLARAHGFGELAKGMQRMLDMEMAMEKEIIEDGEVEEEQAPEAEVELSVEAEVEPEAEVVEKVEEPAVEDEAPAEEPQAEEEQAPEEDPDEELELSVDELTIEMLNRIDGLERTIAELKRAFEASSPVEEAQAEAPLAEGQAEGDTTVELEAALSERPEGELSAPVNRVGAVTETVLPEGDVVEEQKQAAPKDLRESLNLYLSNPNRVKRLIK